MDVAAALWHVLNFFWPATVVALGLAWPLWRRCGRRFGRQLAALWALGAVVLLAGLWLLQRDGAMATYAVMLGVQATWAWAAARRF